MKDLPLNVRKAIVAALNSGKRAEVVTTIDRRTHQRKIVVWAVSGEKEYEQPIA